MFGFVFWLNVFGVGVVGCFVLFCGLCCFVGRFWWVLVLWLFGFGWFGFVVCGFLDFG